MSYKKKLMAYENGLKQKQMLHDFDVTAYKKLNPDLQHMTDKEATRHYKRCGFYENRKYKNVILPSDFDVIRYKQLNYDLQHMTDEEAINHYKNNGFYEERIYNNDIKTALIFHVGNIDIFLKIYNDYMHFFKRNMLIFVTLHNEDFSEIVKQYIPNATISIIENKGMDSVVRGYLVWLGGPGEVRDGPGRPAGWGTSSYFVCLSICSCLFLCLCINDPCVCLSFCLFLNRSVKV